jgi:septal ring factor EnvC (AmiA/AmiB activator)
MKGKVMKKIFAILVVCIFLTPCFSFATDDVARRDLLQERVMRIQAELALMKTQFTEGQKALAVVAKELNELNAKLKPAEKAEKKK